MRSLCVLLLPLIGGIFMSCKNTRAFEKHVKELDSLKVVLQQSVSNFKTVDSSQCTKAYATNYTYTKFLESHLNDTIPKTMAISLQNFQSTGKGLHDFLAHRSSWLMDAGLTIRQLQDLSHDLKTGSLDTEEAIEFILEEKKQAVTMIEALKKNTEMIRKHLEIFYQSLPACESLVKELNHGALPELLQPDIKHTPHL